MAFSLLKRIERALCFLALAFTASVWTGWALDLFSFDFSAPFFTDALLLDLFFVREPGFWFDFFNCFVFSGGLTGKDLV